MLLVAAAVPLGVLLDAPWLPTLALATVAANLTGNLCDTLRRYHFVYEAPARACLVDAVRFTAQTAGLLLFATVPGGASPETALLTLAAAGLAGTVIGLPRQTPSRLSPRLWRAIWPRHWNFIRWMTPGAALESLQSTGLMLIAAAFFSEATIGLLRAIESLANLVLVPVQASTAIAPITASRALRRGGHELMWRELIVITVATGLTALAASMLVTTPAMKTLVVHAGWDWNGDLLLLLFLAANILTIVRLPLVAAVQSIERPQLNFLVASASAASGLCVFFVAVPALSGGAVAAARVAVVLLGIILFWGALKASTPDGARQAAR